MATLRNPDIKFARIRHLKQNYATAEIGLKKGTTVAAGDLVVIKGRYTSDSTTTVGTTGADGVTGDGDKTFTSDGSTFETDNIAENDIIWIKEGKWAAIYVIASVDSETQLTLTVDSNFTEETSLDFEIWTANIFNGRIIDQDFGKTKIIKCDSNGKECIKPLTTATYYGRDGGIIQSILDDQTLNYIGHSFTQTSPYIYRAPHNFRNTDDDASPAGVTNGSIVSDVDGHKKVLSITNQQVTINYVGTPTDGIAEFYIRKVANTKKTHIQFLIPSTGIYMYWDTDGKVYAYDNTTATDVGAYSADTWYHIKIQYDSTETGDETGDWHLWIDDVSKDGGSGYAFYSGASCAGVTDFIILNYEADTTYIDAFGDSGEGNYASGINKEKEYNELDYSGDYTYFMKSIIKENTLKTELDTYVINFGGLWYLTPDHDIRINDADTDSGVELNSSNCDTNGVLGEQQTEDIDVVFLKGAYSGGSRLTSTKGSGNNVYTDTYATIGDQTVLDNLAQKILDREGSNAKSVDLYINYKDMGYIQVGEYLTVAANDIKFDGSGDYLCTENTTFYIRKEIIYIEEGIPVYIYMEMDDALLFVQRGISEDSIHQEGATLTGQVAGGESVGEANTGGNVGGDGVGVYNGKSGVVLQFRHIAPASSKITVTLNGNDIDLDVDPSQIGLGDLGSFNLGSNIITSSDVDGTHNLGRTVLGDAVNHSDNALIKHYDHTASGSYALRQPSGGHTYLNAMLLKSIYFMINNVAKMNMDTDGLQLGAGARVNLFDTDTSLAGGDTAVPTSLAAKTYIDAFGYTTNEEAHAYVEANALTLTQSLTGTDISIADYIKHVGDANTYFGFDDNDSFIMHVAGTQPFDCTALGFRLGVGQRVTTISVDGELGGSNATLCTQNAIKTYVDNAVNNLDWSGHSQAEIDILDGALVTTTELNYLDDVTAGVQAQLDAKTTNASAHAYVEANALTLEANLSLGNNRINLLNSPLIGSDAANKTYVDGLVPTTTKHHLMFPLARGGATYHTNGYIEINAVNEGIAVFLYINDEIDPDSDIIFTWSHSCTSNDATVAWIRYVGAIKTDGTEALSWNVDGGTAFGIDSTVANKLYKSSYTVAHAGFDAGDLVQMEIRLTEAARTVSMRDFEVEYTEL